MLQALFGRPSLVLERLLLWKGPITGARIATRLWRDLIPCASDDYFASCAHAASCSGVLRCPENT